MAIDLNAFRAVAGDSGNVALAQNNTKVTRQGCGLFGRLVAWFRGNENPLANHAVKAEFLGALQNTYGKSFVDSPAVRVLTGGDAGLGLDNAKPLSARLVRDLISMGDQAQQAKAALAPKVQQAKQAEQAREAQAAQAQKERLTQVPLTLRVKGAAQAQVTVTSAYKDEASLMAAAEKFKARIDVTQRQAPVIKAMADYMKDTLGMKNLKQVTDPVCTRFAQAFRPTLLESSFGVRVRGEGFKKACARMGDRLAPIILAQAHHLATFMVAEQISISHRAMSSPDPKSATEASHNFLAAAPRYMEQLVQGMEVLSNPRLIEYRDQRDIDILLGMKAGFESRLQEMKEPDGPFQQLIAYAAMVATDPNYRATAATGG